MSKHTPGPWKAIGTTVYFPDVAGGFDICDAPNPIANARLIAQAPRLLEALEKLVAYDECDDDVDSMFAYAECLKLARAAIEATKGNDNG